MFSLAVRAQIYTASWRLFFFWLLLVEGLGWKEKLLFPPCQSSVLSLFVAFSRLSSILCLSLVCLCAWLFGGKELISHCGERERGASREKRSTRRNTYVGIGGWVCMREGKSRVSESAGDPFPSDELGPSFYPPHSSHFNPVNISLSRVYFLHYLFVNLFPLSTRVSYLFFFLYLKCSLSFLLSAFLRQSGLSSISPPHGK